MDRFWDVGKVPSRTEQLQRTEMSGSRTSTNSCSKDVGRGSSSQDFGAEARMSRRRSVAVTGARVDRSKDVGGKTGLGELAVSFRTSSTLVVNTLAHNVCIELFC